jgi:hypothetical protein
MCAHERGSVPHRPALLRRQRRHNGNAAVFFTSSITA